MNSNSLSLRTNLHSVICAFCRYVYRIVLWGGQLRSRCYDLYNFPVLFLHLTPPRTIITLLASSHLIISVSEFSHTVSSSRHLSVSTTPSTAAAFWDRRMCRQDQPRLGGWNSSLISASSKSMMKQNYEAQKKFISGFFGLILQMYGVYQESGVGGRE